jgi:SAM-dependent methyltransferase
MTDDNAQQFSYENRQEYVSAQIVRSRNKFGYCKVFFADVARYKQLIEMDILKAGKNGRVIRSILCLGVRSGAENDIFRSVFYSPLMRSSWFRRFIAGRDRSKYAADKMNLARFAQGGFLRVQDLRVRGVELNPDVVRPDVHVASFDELPADWSGKFDLIFSNSFDHSQDPKRTIREWRRLAAPGAYLLIAFPPENTPTETDPLGDLSLQKMREYVDAPVVFATETLNLSGYHEICFQLP